MVRRGEENTPARMAALHVEKRQSRNDDLILEKKEEVRSALTFYKQIVDCGKECVVSCQNRHG